MKVTTTLNGANRYVQLDADDGSSLNVLMQHDESAVDTLRRAAEECRHTASRLLKRACAYEAGANHLQNQPVAYGAIAENGNVRVWCAKQDVEATEKATGLKLRPMIFADNSAI